MQAPLPPGNRGSRMKPDKPRRAGQKEKPRNRKENRRM